MVWFGCGAFGGLVYYKCHGFAGFRRYDFGVVCVLFGLDVGLIGFLRVVFSFGFSALFRWFGVVSWVGGLFVGVRWFIVLILVTGVVQVLRVLVSGCFGFAVCLPFVDFLGVFAL